jgi:hypothetical protein
MITGEKLQVLRDYLNILRKYFPFGRGGQLFLTELAMKASTEQVQGSDLAEVIRRAEQEDSQVFSSPQQWLACRGSSPSYRGYPCGLWKLFHYLTVNSAEAKHQQQSSEPFGDSRRDARLRQEFLRLSRLQSTFPRNGGETRDEERVFARLFSFVVCGWLITR